MANNSRYHLVVLLTLVALGVFTLAALSSLNGKSEPPHVARPSSETPHTAKSAEPTKSAAVPVAETTSDAASTDEAPSSSVPAAQQVSSVTWVKDIEQGIKQSAKENKPMMIDFYTDWCGYCKILDRDVYTKPEVAQLAKKFVCIKLNPEKDQKALALARQVKLQGFPFILFVSSTKKAVRAIPGAPDAKTFLAEMKTAYKLAEKRDK